MSEGVVERLASSTSLGRLRLCRDVGIQCGEPLPPSPSALWVRRFAVMGGGIGVVRVH